MTRRPPLDGQTYYTVPNIDEGYVPADQYAPSDLEHATVITSEVAGKPGTHKVVLDIDLPAKLVPSSTPGHFHLYIDKEIEETVYFDLLGALADAGVIEEGYCGASIQRGFTAARLPWVRKGPDAVSSSERAERIERASRESVNFWDDRTGPF